MTWFMNINPRSTFAYQSAKRKFSESPTLLKDFNSRDESCKEQSRMKCCLNQGHQANQKTIHGESCINVQQQIYLSTLSISHFPTPHFRLEPAFPEFVIEWMHEICTALNSVKARVKRTLNYENVGNKPLAIRKLRKIQKIRVQSFI